MGCAGAGGGRCSAGTAVVSRGAVGCAVAGTVAGGSGFMEGRGPWGPLRSHGRAPGRFKKSKPYV